MGVWFEKILDLVYPRLNLCVSCLESIDDGVICKSCLSDITLNKSFDKNVFENFEAMYTCYYSGSIKNIIYNFKVYKNFYCGEYLKDMMSSYLSKNPMDFNYITYVPRDEEKIKREGFDQSLFLSKLLSKEFKIPLVKLIQCKGKKVDQKHTKSNERNFNVMGKFFVFQEVAKKLNNKKILLIDDIATTYSTLKEVVSMIKKTNFKIDVSVLTIAKTLI